MAHERKQTDSSGAVCCESPRCHVDTLRPSVACEVGANGVSHMLSSRQILGPTTLAAPLAILKEKWPAGQALESPHLYLDGTVAVGGKVTVSQPCLPNRLSISLLYANTVLWLLMAVHNMMDS